MAEYDAVVVGAGVMGLSSAYRLAKRGRKVCVLEQVSVLGIVKKVMFMQL